MTNGTDLSRSAAALAHPNIAFIKYWGNRDNELRLPMNGSLSMNLGALTTRTRVTFGVDFVADTLTINGTTQSGASLSRVSEFLDVVRAMAGMDDCAAVVSETNFPLGAGIASSAAAFAALALASAGAAGLSLSEGELSRLARMGSGSACRSVPGGFCEWDAGTGDDDSFARSILPAADWELIDLIAIVSATHKKVGSSLGHVGALSSPYQAIRVTSAPARIEACREAILTKDFAKLASVSEEDSTMMHCVMMTQRPPLFYWEPASLSLMKEIPEWRADGLNAFFTLDAGPNVHVLCTAGDAAEVERRIREVPGMKDVLWSEAGGPARRIDAEFGL